MFQPSLDRLRAHVEALEGERHHESSPGALEAALGHASRELRALELAPHRVPFVFRGRRHENVVATLPGRDPDAPRLLVGAHVDTVRGTPGADDNASGVAGVLETARLLAAHALDAGPPAAPVELALFTLEEQQGWTYRVGSRRFTRRARRRKVSYRGALILEMIGYRSRDAGSQEVPLPLRWKDIPSTGDFLACIGDGKSTDLMVAFREGASAASPALRVVTQRSPLRGWLVRATRRSDNASFWSEGYPALMLTDTANLRNPHYHRRSDRVATLDFDFMGDVTAAVAETVRSLAW